jgi:ParB/RepB/Spo0J family partition protein
MRLAVDLIDVPHLRVRQDLGPVGDLAYSIGSVGLLHPIQVYALRERYRLVAGERRLTAVRMLGWTTIDAFVRDRSDDDLLLELVENTQRKWLTDSEEADALVRLVREEHYELKEVAAQAGRSEAYVSKRIRVFEDPPLRGAIESGRLSVSAAEELLALQPAQRAELLAEAVAGGWEGMRVREAVRALTHPETSGAGVVVTPAAMDESVFEGTFRELDADELSAALIGQAAEATGEHTSSDMARPTDLSRQIQALSRTLRNLRASSLTPREERALAVLLDALLALARAHTGSRDRTGGPVFPSLEEAERSVRRGKAR